MPTEFVIKLLGLNTCNRAGIKLSHAATGPAASSSVCSSSRGGLVRPTPERGERGEEHRGVEVLHLLRIHGPKAFVFC